MKKNKVKKMGRKTVGMMAAVLLCTAGAYQTYSYYRKRGSNQCVYGWRF